MAERFLEPGDGSVDLAEVIALSGDFMKTEFILRNGCTITLGVRVSDACDLWREFRNENKSGYTFYS